MSSSSSVPPSSLLGESTTSRGASSINSSVSSIPSKTTTKSRPPPRSRTTRASLTRSEVSAADSDSSPARTRKRARTTDENEGALGSVKTKAPKRISYGGASKRDRKHYLDKGLFAEDESSSKLRFDGDDEGTTRRASALVANYKLSTAPSPMKSSSEKKIGTLLTLPLYEDGLELLDEERDFQLPFDVMRDFVYHEEVETPEERLERETSRVPPKYFWIPRNIICKRRADVSESEAICSCVRPKDKEVKGCLDNCMNRLMFYTCSPETCPCGDQCSNLPMYMAKGIEEGPNGLVPIWTGSRGFGLKTMVDIKEGDFVIEYRGEIITREESYKRVAKTKGHSFYFLDYDGSEVLDAALKGTGARFINHSCGPNLYCVSWKYSELEEYQVGIFAKEDIAAGTELTYDYGWQNFSLNDIPGFPVASSSSDPDDAPRQQCFCRAEACSGYLGAKKQKVKVVKKGRKAKRSTEKKAATPVKGKGNGRATWRIDQASSDEEDETSEDSDDTGDEGDLVPFNPPPQYYQSTKKDSSLEVGLATGSLEKVIAAVRKPPTVRG